jgi:PAS domain S-box-containing protein
MEIHAVWSEEENEFHLFGFVEDISQRKKAEERQRSAEELYRTMAEKSFAGVYVVQNGRFVFINTNAAQYAGYTKEELLGQPSRAMIHPEDREHARQCAVEMIKGKRDIPYEFRVVTKQGEIRWIMEALTSINYQGKAAILGNSIDITEHKSIATERENIILQLQKALMEVKTLNGLLPICSSCKKIRNDEGYWEQLEVYIRDHSEAEFSHGICPDCARELYPDYFKE